MASYYRIIVGVVATAALLTFGYKMIEMYNRKVESIRPAVFSTSTSPIATNRQNSGLDDKLRIGFKDFNLEDLNEQLGNIQYGPNDSLERAIQKGIELSERK